MYDGDHPTTPEAHIEPQLAALLDELERFGIANDSAGRARADSMLNITRDTGEFLAVMVHATAARRILEIGTSNGYSTLWLADAARSAGASVTAVEPSAAKAALARANFARAGLAPQITLVEADAGVMLAAGASASVDLIFLDAERSLYLAWWPNLRRMLRPGGLLIVDNALSHAEQMAAFMQQVASDGGFATSVVAVGKGEFLAASIRQATPAA